MIRLRDGRLRTSIAMSLLAAGLLAVGPIGTARGISVPENGHAAIVRVAPPASTAAAAQQDLRGRAEALRRTLQQLQRAAQAAGAAEFAAAAELIGEAQAQAQAAQANLGSGDFASAVADFEGAVSAIQRAVAVTAAAATAARQQAEAASRGALRAVEGAAAQVERGANLERRGRFNDARLAYLDAAAMYEEVPGAGPANPLLVVLDGYEEAMEAEDIAAYRALWTNLNPNVERGIANSFEQFEAWQIEYSEAEIVVQGEETATVRAVQSLRFVDASTGNPVVASTRVTFTLRKNADRWLIETMTQETIQ